VLTVRRTSILLAIVALLAGACGKDDKPSAPAFDTRPHSNAVPVRLDVRASGKTEFRYNKDARVRIVTFRPAKRELSLLSVGIEGFTPLADGSQFRFAFDVTGTYDGPGTFTIRPSSSSPLPAGGTDLSNALLMQVRLKDPTAPLSKDNVSSALKFDKTSKACTVELENDRRSGHLDCPALADETGQIVHMRVRWTAHT
jgi:hypothetical protein